MTLIYLSWNSARINKGKKPTESYVFCAPTLKPRPIMWPQNTLIWGRGVWFVYILIYLRITFSKHFENLVQNLGQIKNNPSSFSSKNQKQQASNKDYWFLYNKSVADKLTFTFVVVATFWSWDGRKGDEMNVRCLSPVEENITVTHIFAKTNLIHVIHWSRLIFLPGICIWHSDEKGFISIKVALQQLT